MKTTNILLHIGSIACITMAISFTSCKKKTSDGDVAPTSVDLSTEQDLSNANNDVNSVLRDVEKTFDDSANNNLREESTYATIVRSDVDTSINETKYTKKTVVTYSGTTADDGQTRNGTTIIYHNGSRVNENLMCFVSFSGTKVGGRTITGTKTITQKPSNDAKKWIFDISGSGTITNIDGISMNYSTFRTRTRSGIDTKLNITDDTFAVTGSWEGTNAKGENVSATIVSPLLHTALCKNFREITAGRIDFTNKSKNVTRTVDYGSGGCDGKGIFIQNCKEFTFSFKR